MAFPADKTNYGYISEHTAFGSEEQEIGDFAEDLASTMMPTKPFRSVLGLAVICLLSLAAFAAYHRSAAPITARILAVNDFHGQLQPLVNRDLAGGAARLVAALKSAEKGMTGAP